MGIHVHQPLFGRFPFKLQRHIFKHIHGVLGSLLFHPYLFPLRPWDHGVLGVRGGGLRSFERRSFRLRRLEAGGVHVDHRGEGSEVHLPKSEGVLCASGNTRFFVGSASKGNPKKHHMFFFGGVPDVDRGSLYVDVWTP